MTIIRVLLDEILWLLLLLVALLSLWEGEVVSSVLRSGSSGASKALLN